MKRLKTKVAEQKAPLARQKFDNVAAQHAGTVQFHGRLFAQWMHRAFPHGWQFPHVSGSITPVTPDEWLDSKGKEHVSRDAKVYHPDEHREASTV